MYLEAYLNLFEKSNFNIAFSNLANQLVWSIKYSDLSMLPDYRMVIAVLRMRYLIAIYPLIMFYLIF